ncbi:MAG: permease [Planctomycetota bacterium]|nr:permease [Planctomycetota bacterium]
MVGGGTDFALVLLQEYARLHVLMCLLPAFFIAGAISVFIGSSSVIKYFGRTANEFMAYAVASVSGTILAVCWCTILPLFAGVCPDGSRNRPGNNFPLRRPCYRRLGDPFLTARSSSAKLPCRTRHRFVQLFSPS